MSPCHSHLPKEIPLSSHKTVSFQFSLRKFRFYPGVALCTCLSSYPGEYRNHVCLCLQPKSRALPTPSAFPKVPAFQKSHGSGAPVLGTGFWASPEPLQPGGRGLGLDFTAGLLSLKAGPSPSLRCVSWRTPTSPCDRRLGESAEHVPEWRSEALACLGRRGTPLSDGNTGHFVLGGVLTRVRRALTHLWTSGIPL